MREVPLEGLCLASRKLAVEVGVKQETGSDAVHRAGSRNRPQQEEIPATGASSPGPGAFG